MQHIKIWRKFTFLQKYGKTSSGSLADLIIDIFIQL